MTTWVEVRTAVLAANAAAVRAYLGPHTSLCAVVKANGYGHGAVLAAEAFLAGGADRLAVTTVAEAVELRDGGIAERILLLASHAADEAMAVVEHGLTATISDLPAAERLVAAAGGRPLRVHLLVDTGMGRDGVLPDSAVALYERLQELPGLTVEGVYTHFPNSIARQKEPTREQLKRFLAVVERLQPRPALVHAANSGAAVDLPESRLDMARVGTLLYGQYPSPHVTRAVKVAEAWTLKSRLVEIRRLPAGASIGYGSEQLLRGERLVGTLLVGWQHGFTLIPESLARGWQGVARALRGRRPTVRVNGVACPVLGRVSMQTTVVDVTDVPNVAVGDLAELPARRVTLDRGVPRIAIS